MVTKWATKAVLEVIPPRFCITFRRASFGSRLKTSKSRLWDDWAENTINTGPGSHDNSSEKVENHENRSELDPYSIFRAENQAIWIPKVLSIQWGRSGPPKLLYDIQNRPKIQKTQLEKVYTKLFRRLRWSKSRLWGDWAGNTINTGQGSHDNFIEHVQIMNIG